MTEEDRELREGILSLRLYLYTLFYRAFDQPPDEDFVQSLTGDAAWESLRTLAFDHGSRLWSGADFLYSLQEQDAAVFLAQIQQEYDRLFSGTDSPPVPLRQSAYRQEESRAQKARPLLQKLRHTLGLEPPVTEDELPYQLNAMAELCQSALTALQKQNKKQLRKLLSEQRSFLERHLLLWIPDFAKQAASVPDGVLYPQLAGILDAFLQTEPSQLDLLSSGSPLAL